MKLSKKMVEVMEYLQGADWYYLDEAKKDSRTVQSFHTKDGIKSCFKPAHILKGGLVGITGHTSTLKALEKRGLIEIITLGGIWMDIVKLVGADWEAPHKYAVKVSIYRDQYNEYCGQWINQTLEEYVELGFLEDAEANYKSDYPAWTTVEFTMIKEVELTIWDGKSRS